MSFGYRNPFSYTHSKGLPVKHPESYDTCQICGIDTKPKDGFVPLAPCVVPFHDFIGDQHVYLTCSTCYGKHQKLRFMSIDEFKDSRSNRRGPGRRRGSTKGAIDLIANGGQQYSRQRFKAAKRLAECANPLTELVKEIEDFEALMVKKLGALKAMLLEAMPLKIEDGEKLRVKTHLEPEIDVLGALSDDIDPGDTRETADEDFGIDDNDDDDFMTDEQRAKFEALKNRSGPVLPTMAPPEVDRSDW